MKEQKVDAARRGRVCYGIIEGSKKVGVLFHDENFWLTQKALAELFNVKVPAISRHLKNIFLSGELDEDSVVSILERTAADGKNYRTKCYNLDAIIAVGCRVNSYQATQFRIWATKTLKEFFATVQKKLHWAIIGKTAAEIIYDSAKAEHYEQHRCDTPFMTEGMEIKNF